MTYNVFSGTLNPTHSRCLVMQGTPLYMSPELVMEKPYDHTADLWYLLPLELFCVQLKDVHILKSSIS